MERKRRILLIDDDAVMHDLVRAFLTRVGYEFAGAADGGQGLEAVLEYQPDLILLDYMMPEMDGIGVYERLRSDPEFAPFRDVPVIMLTARDDDAALRSDMLRRGVFAYLNKPFGLHELRNVIENAFIVSEINRRNVELQEEIRKARDFLQSVVDAAPVGIFFSDPEGKIVLANRFLASLLGLRSGSELVGLDLLTIGLAGGWPRLSAVERVLVGGEPYASEHFPFVATDGRRLLLSVRCVPQREPDGRLRGSVGILEDVTAAEKRAVEMTMLTQIAHAMQGTLDLDELLHLILTCVTAGEALGFSRAMIFLLSEDESELRGTMGVGPSSREEAITIWESLSREKMTLPEFLDRYGRRPPDAEDRFNRFVQGLRHPLSHSNCVLVRALQEQRAFIVSEKGAGTPPASCEWLSAQLASREFVCVPLVARGKGIGVVVADNLYTGHPLDESLVELLSLLANQAGLAIERARAYANVARQKEELEKALDKLQEAQARLLEAERLATIGQMAAQVAHEIRNPLVTIGGFARSLLEAPRSPEETRVILGIIAEEAKRLENILNNVLDFTRLSRPKPSWVDLNEAIQKTVFLVQEELHKKKIRLEKHLDLGLPKVYADEAQMRQVLLNLLYNALDSMTDGGQLTVATCRVDPEQVLVEICDTGPGISEDVLQNMFNPFFTTKPDGTGLGLPIVQQIVHAHGGRILVDSEIGKGTTFRIFLPIEGRAVGSASRETSSPSVCR
ncbi:MAG: ATP-binding protein [candidate division KSB1 bacterium]|nr:ATP-binding protein [candidate division KSB1 bacterium]